MPEAMTVLTWNVQWAAPKFLTAVARTLSASSPDLVVVTEGVESVLPQHGYRAVGGPDWGYPAPAERRKVLLWSPHPLHEINVFDEVPLPPGRLVTAVCDTPGLGSVWVVGVCIPWRDAHVRTGRADAQPWDEHLSFLQHLPSVLNSAPAGLPIVLAGDFNQRIPATRVPTHVASALTEALGSLQVATTGVLSNLRGQGVDHVCHSRDLRTARTWGIDRDLGGERAVSDHDLVAVELQPAPS